MSASGWRTATPRAPSASSASTRRAAARPWNRPTPAWTTTVHASPSRRTPRRAASPSRPARSGVGVRASSRSRSRAAPRGSRVTVGLHEQKVADFDDAADWKFSAARAERLARPGAGGPRRYGPEADLRLQPVHGHPRRVRQPAAGRAGPGQPQSFTLWIKGDGKGAWPSLHLKDAGGTDQVLRGDLRHEEGWQQVTFEVPEGVAYPLRCTASISPRPRPPSSTPARS